MLDFQFLSPDVLIYYLKLLKYNKWHAGKLFIKILQKSNIRYIEEFYIKLCEIEWKLKLVGIDTDPPEIKCLPNNIGKHYFHHQFYYNNNIKKHEALAPHNFTPSQINTCIGLLDPCCLWCKKQFHFFLRIWIEQKLYNFDIKKNKQYIRDLRDILVFIKNEYLEVLLKTYRGTLNNILL